MKTIAALLLCLAASLATFANVNEQHAVVVNLENTEPITDETVSDLILGKRQFWDGGQVAVIAILKDNETVAKCLKQFTGMDMEQYASHWERLAKNRGRRVPKFFSNPEAVIAFVSINPGAIGILAKSTNLDKVKVIR